MSSVSPAPNSSPSAVPPAAAPPPSATTQPPNPSSSSPPAPSVASQPPTPSSSSPPPISPPRPDANSPDSSAPSPPPPQTSPPSPVDPVSPPTPSPPPKGPPQPSPPPPPLSPSPPPPPVTPPPKSSPLPLPPPPPSAPTPISPPAPPANPPQTPSPPLTPTPNPPQTPSPPPSSPPKTSPPSPPVAPPQGSPPPPLTPPTPSQPPKSSPPSPPMSSTLSPSSGTPTKSRSPPVLAPQPASSPTPNSTPKLSPLPSPISPPSLTPPAHAATPVPTTEILDSKGNSSPGTGGIVAIAAVLGILFLSLVGFAVWYMRKRSKRSAGTNGGYIMPSPSASSLKSDSAAVKSHPSAPLIGSSSGSEVVNSPREHSGIGHSGPWFTYQQLMEATNGFSSQNLLGEGGFGSVYKGCLPDGRVVAVKQLKVGGGQGEREFKAEVETISRIHHRHLVSLVGFCIADNRRLLVYDFVANNTLYFHLHVEVRPFLDWAKRFRIAAGAARGLAYLHEDCHPRIIHRDIKSSNILLDNNFEARVSDFGLAKLALDDANTHVTTRVMGTFGYMAPEYASSGKLTEKSDVYSFGVVLLELITGRKPVDASQPLGDESLVEWARPLLSHALNKEDFQVLADPRLENNFVESEMFRMIEAAAACVRHSAAKRPRMGQVVRAFDSLATSDLMNGMRVGESEIFNSAEQSAEIRLFRRMAFGSQDYSTDFFSRTSSNI